MKRFHVHVAVDDLNRSIGFYSALFAAEPSIIKTDYAKWMLDDPRVNFAISTRGRQTMRLLQSLGYDASGFRSKSWSEFAERGAPSLDFVFTVCDNAAGETCPLWPGQPITAHWGVPDPAEAKGTEAEMALAFKEAYRMLNQRIGIFTALPLRSLDQLTLQRKLRDIGNVGNAVEPT